LKLSGKIPSSMKLPYKVYLRPETGDVGAATSPPYSNTKVALERFYAGITQITARRAAKKCRIRPRVQIAGPSLGLSGGPIMLH
jgi:hypothetical protein